MRALTCPASDENPEKNALRSSPCGDVDGPARLRIGCTPQAREERSHDKATARRHHDEEDRGLARDRYGDDMRSRSRSAPPVRRSRPVAADFFHDGTQSRSQSPEDDRDRKDHHHHHHRRHRRRSRDAEAGPDDRREHKRRKRDHHHHKKASSTAPLHDPPPPHAELPFGARALSCKHDLEVFTPLFAYYLDIQKGRDFYGMNAHERRGRWKSFVHRWNRGELAEGWYDPEMFERVAREADEAVLEENAARERGASAGGGDEALVGDPTPPLDDERRGVGDGEEDDDYGPPPPPGQTGASRGVWHPRRGPGMPTLDDLTLRGEDAAAAREAEIADLRVARRADRALQRQQLDEILPRAEAGTRERQLEKRALVSEKMRGFKEARGEGGGIEEVGDGDLMGGGDDVQALKRAAAAQQRKKTERELRREAEARARMEEREGRLREWREREEEKMKGLKELARARFG